MKQYTTEWMEEEIDRNVINRLHKMKRGLQPDMCSKPYYTSKPRSCKNCKQMHLDTLFSPHGCLAGFGVEIKDKIQRPTDVCIPIKNNTSRSFDNAYYIRVWLLKNAWNPKRLENSKVTGDDI